MKDKVQVATLVIKSVSYSGRYLVGKRAAHKPFPGLWEFLGGKIEPGESLGDAALREASEETGFDKDQFCDMEVFGVVESRPVGSDKVYVLNLVKLTLTTDPTDIRAVDHSELAWLSKDEILALHLVSEANREIARRLA